MLKLVHIVIENATDFDPICHMIFFNVTRTHEKLWKRTKFNRKKLRGSWASPLSAWAGEGREGTKGWGNGKSADTTVCLHTNRREVGLHSWSSTPCMMHPSIFCYMYEMKFNEYHIKVLFVAAIGVSFIHLTQTQRASPPLGCGNFVLADSAHTRILQRSLCFPPIIRLQGYLDLMEVLLFISALEARQGKHS